MALIPLVFKYLSPAQDTVHASGAVYRPTGRDDAQRYRDWLLERLAASEDPSADEALLGLLHEPALAERRDWILHLIDERRARQADLSAWEPRNVRDFAEHYETDPQIDRDLFIIAKHRLSDIRYSVEKADISARHELDRNADEATLRSWLASKLRDQSRGRYVVPQEAEIDLAQRPDLRLEAPGVGSVPIEVKWADKWSGPELSERLENQLIGQYLRAHETHYGFYLLGHRGTKQQWQLSSGERVGFEQLQQVLQARALEIVGRIPDVHAVEVIGISFYPSPQASGDPTNGRDKRQPSERHP
jgi:hypothetical protein